MYFVQQGDLEEINIPIDFLGVNYDKPGRRAQRGGARGGRTNQERFRFPTRPELTDMGWEVSSGAG